jgi:SAM-dependent methyltransferase
MRPMTARLATALPLGTRNRLLRFVRGADHPPPPGWVDWGSLRRLSPISRSYGIDRGTPIDRYFIDDFIAANRRFIRGRVLEVGGDVYATRFGGGRIDRLDILHAAPGNPAATIVDDLAVGNDIPSATFDCFICVQTLQYIPDAAAAVRTVWRLLRPGGVFLGTVPGICYHNIESDPWPYFAPFSRWSARRLFTQVFPSDKVRVRSHGNVLTATAFLHGLSAEELTQAELDHRDDGYQFAITIRAIKPDGDPAQ